jgi:hypothetical protein
MKRGDKEGFQTQAEVDKDFDIYESGVLRLKDLKGLLDHLNTIGFWKEEKNIRSKLRYMSKIPEIEEEIEALKKKIIKKHGKENLYKRSFAKKRRKKKKKDEVVVGDIPEPIEENPEEKVSGGEEGKKQIFNKLVPFTKKKDSQKKYEQEVKGAIEQRNKEPVQIDSSSSESQEREKKKLELEKAQIEKEKKEGGWKGLCDLS